jgi:hypothetical protein
MFKLVNGLACFVGDLFQFGPDEQGTASVIYMNDLRH